MVASSTGASLARFTRGARIVGTEEVLEADAEDDSAKDRRSKLVIELERLAAMVLVSEIDRAVASFDPRKNFHA